MPDYRWMKNLTPDEAQAALRTLDARDPPMTVGEIMGLRELRLALQAKVENKRPPAKGR